jgi:hypothetical protein
MPKYSSKYPSHYKGDKPTMTSSRGHQGAHGTGQYGLGGITHLDNLPMAPRVMECLRKIIGHNLSELVD